MSVAERFWKQWLVAEESEQLELIEKLPVCQLEITQRIALGAVLNSHFRDLAYYLRQRNKMADKLFDAAKTVFVDADDRGETCDDDGREYKDWKRLRKALNSYEGKKR